MGGEALPFRGRRGPSYELHSGAVTRGGRQGHAERIYSGASGLEQEAEDEQKGTAVVDPNRGRGWDSKASGFVIVSLCLF